MCPWVVGWENNQPPFFRGDPLGQIQKLRLSALFDVIQVEDVNARAPCKLLATVLRVPDVITARRYGFLEFVRVDGVLRIFR